MYKRQVSSIEYIIRTVNEDSNPYDDFYYIHYWDDDNCPRIENRYYIRVTDTNDPENTWEIWLWDGTGSFNFLSNPSSYTLYMDSNNPIIGCP